jgi:hypothetical protein
VEQPVSDFADAGGLTPEEFVRRFLIAWRAWELEAERISDEDEAEEKRGEQTGEEGLEESDISAIDIQYRELIKTFATPRVIAQDVGASWGSPPTANLATTEFVATEKGRAGVVVRTREMGHYALPPAEYEYLLKIVEGEWRIDDRRSRNLDGRWIHRLF